MGFLAGIKTFNYAQQEGSLDTEWILSWKKNNKFV